MSKVSQQDVLIHKLPHGLTLVAEPMAEVLSAAFVLLTPAGVAYDPPGLTGTAAVLSELVYRGAGPYDNRALNERLDGLGLHRHTGVTTLHCDFGGALLGDNLLEALRLHADLVLRPRLEEEHFKTCRRLALQNLASLDDEPQQKVALLTQENHLPYPFGRPAPGKAPDLQALSCAALRRHWADRFIPHGSILALAGRFDFPRLRQLVEDLFGGWQGPSTPPPATGACVGRTCHQPFPGAQVHVGLMIPSVPVGHDDYYAALAAVHVLSGGMGSRLFTEVREKRGLCYAVGAAHRVYGPFGVVRCYLGSTPERAQEALDVTLEQLRGLARGIAPEELDRAKVGLRASLVMQGESTTARALACAADYHHLSRVRSLAEIDRHIQALTVDDLLAHVARCPVQNLTVATIGPKEINVAT